MCEDFFAYRLKSASTPKIKLWESKEYGTLIPQLKVHVMLLVPSGIILMITLSLEITESNLF